MSSSPGVSITVVCFNEQENIERCLGSATWADEIVVVDSFSTDDTPARARRYTDRVYQHAWPGYAAQKNYAVRLARNDWILSVDADEWCSPHLAEEVRQLMAGGPTCAAYRVQRRSRLLGGWVRHAWGADWIIRLFDRRRGAFSGGDPHDSVEVRPGEPVGKLTGKLYHDPYRNLSDFVVRMDRYSSLQAAQVPPLSPGRAKVKMVLSPTAAFVRMFLLKRGFLDGHRGLIVSAVNALYHFLKYAKAWELQQHPPSPVASPPE